MIAGVVVIVMKPWEQTVEIGGVEVKTKGFYSMASNDDDGWFGRS